ncbi:hypothetical protein CAUPRSCDRAFT_7161 [Caulochytrium protostelioides]|uniref:KRR1 small subunit processome component n=1 Tax=Caulochytrium protostelioides TaxID=1555241 RepID=A0A4P9WWZ5_9FUNG|nr:hypothetical protein CAUPRSCDRAFT_7161 [Caulochytrium protostelioides]
MSAVEAASAAAAAPAAPVSKSKQHRKDKPWDTDDIDKWKIEPFLPSNNPGPFTEESSFITLFPKYREKYLREVWKLVTAELDKWGIACELDLVEGSMSVKTTRKTWDPYAILNARDMIKLLARSLPVQQAMKIMQDDMACDIIKIGNQVRNKERFVRRRQRLIGPNGNTLKALELLTGCYILVQGNTVAAMGPYKGLKDVRRVVLDCLHNIHPIYHIKELMVKRELAKDEKLKGESWDRFLPKYKKRATPRPKKSAIVPKPEKSVFPPLPPQSKIDMQIESGEFFMSQEKKNAEAREARLKREAKKQTEREQRREAAFVPPPTRSTPAASTPVDAKPADAALTMDQLKAKVKARALKRMSTHSK